MRGPLKLTHNLNIKANETNSMLGYAAAQLKGSTIVSETAKTLSMGA